jgi:hypothetical protein
MCFVELDGLPARQGGFDVVLGLRSIAGGDYVNLFALHQRPDIVLVVGAANRGVAVAQGADLPGGLVDGCVDVDRRWAVLWQEPNKHVMLARQALGLGAPLS